MRERFLDILACPDCGGALALAAERGAGDDVREGQLRCGGCGRAYAVRRGIPRFVPAALTAEVAGTSRAFGYSWGRFHRLYDRYRNQLLEWIPPVTLADLEGRVLLDGGCGKGRHLALAAQQGAKLAVGADLSSAVEVAYENTARFKNALVVQADLHALPFRPVFDYGWSIGVLHHIADPAAALRGIVRCLQPGARFSVWMYGRENNGWIVRAVNPFRERFTSRLPFPEVDWVACVLALLLYPVCHGLYAPAEKRHWRALFPFLFYRPYLAYLGQFDFEEVHSIVLDHLIAPVAGYFTGDETRRIVAAAGLHVLKTTWVRENSWAVYAEKP